MTSLRPDEPIATNEGVPVLHRALTACFHLDWASPEQEGGMLAATDLLLDWLGEHLTWTWSSLVGIPEPFQPEDLRFMALYPGGLPECEVEGLSREDAAEIISIEAARRNGTEILCKGGPFGPGSSPFGVAFHADVTGFAPQKGLLAPMALQVSVPTSWDLADFERRVTEIAALLPIRWGCAGFGYARWGSLHYEDAEATLFAHARRHPGYDVGYAAAFLGEFFDQLRTVSWLTFLGADHEAALARLRRRPLTATPHTTLRRVGPHVLVKAGAAPVEGDVNHLDLPRAYVEADALLRPIRRREGVNFADRWDESTTEAWLRRFERILS